MGAHINANDDISKYMLILRGHTVRQKLRPKTGNKPSGGKKSYFGTTPTNQNYVYEKKITADEILGMPATIRLQKFWSSCLIPKNTLYCTRIGKIYI